MALGIPVSELGERVSSYELMEWTAFERVFGPLTIQERTDAAAGLTWQPPGEEEQGPQNPMDMIAVMRDLQARKRARGNDQP